MDFTLSEERQIFKDTAERFLEDCYPIETRHNAASSPQGFDRDLWASFAEMGIVGALLPPDVGGFGGEGVDVAVVFELLGRRLVVEPFLATGVLGAAPLVLAGSEAQRNGLEAVVAGERLLALAHGEPTSRYGLSEVATRAERTADGWRLTGTKAVVLNGDSADALVVSARVAGAPADEAGLGLFLVEGHAPGLVRRGYGGIEGGRAAEIRLDGVPAEPVGEPGSAYPVIEAVVGRGVLALAAEGLGLMEACRALTLDYVKTRTQFGRPIGSFQALQHRLVDMVLEIEQARSSVMLAAATLDGDRLTRERNLSAAKHLAGKVGRFVAEETIQIHGGIAMTWEYAAGHYAKRLVMLDHLLGDTDHHLERFIRLGEAA